MCLLGEDYIASVRRMGVIFFRISMILSALRIIESGDYASKLTCSDADFITSLELIKILIQHTEKIFKSLPIKAKTSTLTNTDKKQIFLDQLPTDFSIQNYKNTAENLNIPFRTAEGYITEFVKVGLLTRLIKGNYRKSKK